MVALVKGELGLIRGDPELLQHLNSISPVLHAAYRGLQSDAEEYHFQTLIGKIFEVYKQCFKPGPQWFETTGDSLPKQSCEKYVVSGKPKIRNLPTYVTKQNQDDKICPKHPYNVNDMTGNFFVTCTHGYFIISILMQVLNQCQ